MLIRNATLMHGDAADIRLDDSRITAIAPVLAAVPGEMVLDARGGAVLTGLHDHHIHLLALAAARASFDCAPYRRGDDLAMALRRAARGQPWLRATHYHESIAGDIDRHWLDAAVPDTKVRVQHRSGRLWIFNSAAIAALRADGGFAPLERAAGCCTGRLYDGDDWLRGQLRAAPPDLAPVGAMLAEYGITGVTDATPGNGQAFFDIVAAAQGRGALRQRVAAMGRLEIRHAPAQGILFPLALKVHLHEDAYPAPEHFIGEARAACDAGLGVAVHCVTPADLVFALSLLREAGVAGQSRIEHASVVSPDMIAGIAQACVSVVTQPNFVAERGDSYLNDICVDAHDDMYRCKSLLQAGIRVGGGTDAPFGGANPWAAMHAAVTRRTARGQMLGAGECVSPEAALALFSAPLTDPGGTPRAVCVGAPADLCVLTRPWAVARENLAAVSVLATIADGGLIHRQNQTGRKVA